MASQKPSIAEIFNKMDCGTSVEDCQTLQDWLNQQDKKLGNFINNKFVIPEKCNFYECKTSDDKFLALSVEGSEDDVNLAVKTAEVAFENWSSSNHIRSRYLYSIARNIQKHVQLLSIAEAVSTGLSIKNAKNSISKVVQIFYHYAGWAQLQVAKLSAYTPHGVVIVLVSGNHPFHVLAMDIGAALSMGNTVVLKPASDCRLSALLFGYICSVAGVPPGVVSVVTGDSKLNSTIAVSKHVSKVTYLGNVDEGKLIKKITAGLSKHLSCVLGDNGSIIVFDSADYNAAIDGIVEALCLRTGKGFSFGSRVLVQSSIFTAFLSMLKEKISTLKMGLWLDKQADITCCLTLEEKEVVEKLIGLCKQTGTEVFQATATHELIYPPTLLIDAGTTSECFRQEIPGPVISVMPFRTAKEAITLSNNTSFGLSACIYSENLTDTIEVAKKLNVGHVWINCFGASDASMCCSSYKKSGNAIVGGIPGLSKYVKSFFNTKAPLDDFDFSTFGVGSEDEETKKEAYDELKNESIIPHIDKTYKLFIGGSQKRPEGNASYPIYNHDKTLFAFAPSSSRKDVRNAVEAAAKAYSGWSQNTGFNRAQILYFIAENLEERVDEFVCHLISLTGNDKEECKKEVLKAVEQIFYWASLADKFGGSVCETQMYGTVMCIHESVGVFGVVCPDFQPLLSFISLVMPLLARGNTVVVVPSEMHSTIVLSFAQILLYSDLPAGVLNILAGSQDALTRTLVEHQECQGIWYALLFCIRLNLIAVV